MAYLFTSQALAPAGLLLLRKIDERAFWDNQWLQLLEELAPTRRHKSISDSPT